MFGKKNGTKKRPDSTPAILVAGDWIVDDHWMVGHHRSPSSSRIGRRHSRSLHGKECSVRSLCGAGQVATILHQANYSLVKSPSTIGLGIWHLDDDLALEAMLDPGNNTGKVPHRLSEQTNERNSSTKSSNLKLCNIIDQEHGLEVGTVRVFRIYSNIKSKLELIHRIDWELPIDRERIKNLNYDDNRKLSALRSDSVKYIVITDLLKGAITSNLIEWLAGSFPDARWFVYSKAWISGIEWLQKQVLKGKIDLLMVPQWASRAALRHDDFSSSAWITPGAHASPAALDQIEKLSTSLDIDKIVVLPNGMTVLSKYKKTSGVGDTKDVGIIQSGTGPESVYSFTPMASVFFPSIIANLIDDRRSEFKDFQDILKHALNFTARWMRWEVQRLTSGDWRPNSIRQTLDLSESSGKVKDDDRDKFNWTAPFEWRAERQEWAAAFSGRGVVNKEKGKKEFHLWRSMVDIDGYVCCTEFKKRIIQELLREGEMFRSGAKDRHMSFMLIDTPGSGKSYLVHRLAKSLGMRFLPFNITQMLSRSDLLHCFDTIVTNQARDPEVTILVFIDEINAKLDGHPIYGSFLAPLEDGFYIRSGNRFYIPPCLWIFAGTDLPSESVGGDRKSSADAFVFGRTVSKADKGSDFLSRLTCPPFDLRSAAANLDCEELCNAEVEKVYIGVSTLRLAFPDVRYISEKVLEAFRILPQNISPRGISRFAKSFDSIQYGRVVSTNLPEGWLARLGITENKQKEWVGFEESMDDLVSIKHEFDSNL